jgi:DNA-binding MarR family transcriptional regulator
MSSPDTNGRWHFLTSHTQVLLAIYRDPDVRLRDIATTVGITERAAQRIVNDLVDAGYVTRERHGRRNRYAVLPHGHMRHPEQLEHEIGEFMEHLRSHGD